MSRGMGKPPARPQLHPADMNGNALGCWPVKLVQTWAMLPVSISPRLYVLQMAVLSFLGASEHTAIPSSAIALRD
eukprot:1159416-Pelagomonas_calceolata.AAC.12